MRPSRRILVSTSPVDLQGNEVELGDRPGLSTEKTELCLFCLLVRKKRGRWTQFFCMGGLAESRVSEHDKWIGGRYIVP